MCQNNNKKKRLMSIFSNFFSVPKPRQEWVDGNFVKHEVELEEPWVSLFIDLLFVVLLSKLGGLLHYCEASVYLYFKLSVFFWSLCLSRFAIDEYANRFFSNDLLHKLMYLVYTFGIVIQVLSINHSKEVESKGDINEYSGKSASEIECAFPFKFSAGMLIGILVTRLSMIGIHAALMYVNEKARKQFFFDIIRWGITCLIIAIRLLMQQRNDRSSADDVVIIGITVVQEVAGWVISRSFFRKYFVVPVDLEALQFRWGIWVMIVIGESIIQMLHLPLSEKHFFDTYGMTFVAVVLMFSQGMQYFDCCHIEWFDHALTKSALSGISWIWLHFPMTYHLFRVGATFGSMFEHLHEGHELDELTVATFSVSLAAVNFCVTMIHLSNVTVEVLRKDRRAAIQLTLRLMCCVLQVSVQWWGYQKPMDLLIIHTVISVLCLNLVDVISGIFPNLEDVKIWYSNDSNDLEIGESVTQRPTDRVATAHETPKLHRTISRRWSELHLASAFSDHSSDVDDAEATGKQFVAEEVQSNTVVFEQDNNMIDSQFECHQPLPNIQENAGAVDGIVDSAKSSTATNPKSEAAAGVMSRRKSSSRSPSDSPKMFFKRASGLKSPRGVFYSQSSTEHLTKQQNLIHLHQNSRMRSFSKSRDCLLPNDLDMSYDGFVFTVKNKQSSCNFDDWKKRKDAVSRSSSVESHEQGLHVSGNQQQLDSARSLKSSNLSQIL